MGSLTKHHYLSLTWWIQLHKHKQILGIPQLRSQWGTLCSECTQNKDITLYCRNTNKIHYKCCLQRIWAVVQYSMFWDMTYGNIIYNKLDPKLLLLKGLRAWQFLSQCFLWVSMLLENLHFKLFHLKLPTVIQWLKICKWLRNFFLFSFLLLKLFSLKQ